MTAAPAARPAPAGRTPAAAHGPRLALAAGLVGLAAVAVRVVLLPSPGLVADLDMFATWAHWLATNPLSEAFNALQLSYGPVVTYLLALLAALQPAFADSSDTADLGARLTLKLPPVLADLGIALLIWWEVRSRVPGRRAVALAALGAVGLSPAIWYVSAWWGQYDSLYVLAALAGFALVVRGRHSWATAAMVAAVLTKPQAVVLLVPFAAYLAAVGGWRGLPRPVAAGAATAIVLWLPFLPSGGLEAYLGSVAAFQDSLFGVLSLRAWNPWWIVQVAATGGEFALDRTAIVGPLTFRGVGLAIAALLELVVVAAVWRRPSATTLAWGLAASTLVAFVSLTTMHERYSYPALVFLALLFADRRAVALWTVLSVAVTLNLVAAIPFSAEAAAAVPVAGVVGILGSTVITACALATVAILYARRPDDDSRRAEPDPRSTATDNAAVATAS